jgi:diguanylate cyclase (GGDEF)-like protein
MLARPAIHAATVFDAVGEITIAPAAEPIVALVLPASLLMASPTNPPPTMPGSSGVMEAAGTAPRLIDAFRRLDPSIRLIAVAELDSDRRALGQAADRLDGVLVAPFTALEVARVLELETAANADPAAPAAPPPHMPHSPPAVAASAPAPPTTPAPIAAPAPAEATPPPAVPPRPAIPAAAAPAPAPAAVSDPGSSADPTSDDPLGDTDLVESLLTSPDGVLVTAIRLIVQQTEWTDVALIEGDSLPPRVAAHPVTFNGRSFGRLATAFASADDLRPWADWLARWLALDRAHRDYRAAAFRDDLTSAWNRRFFDTFLAQAIADAGRRRRPVTLMVFDIDDFKRYNDTFGHEAGDDILRETVKLMNSVIRKGDRVCRIGGDEFAVVFADPEGPREAGSMHPEQVETIAKRFQDQVSQMKFPKLGRDAPGPLTISGGLATYPWDGLDPRSLLHHADQLALQSKRRGKNVITLGPGISPPRPAGAAADAMPAAPAPPSATPFVPPSAPLVAPR